MTAGSVWPRRLASGPIVVLAAVGLTQLGRRQVWQDEAYTWSTVTRPWSELRQLVTGGVEVNASVYNALEWLATRGDTAPWRLRALSLVAAMAGAWAAKRLAERLLPPRARLLAVSCAALGGVSVHYAVEARTYALTGALVAGAALAADADRRQPRPAAWVAWVLLGAAAGYGHLFGVLSVGAVGVAAVGDRARRGRTLLAGAATGVLLVPLGLWLSAKTGDEGLGDVPLDRRAVVAALRAYAFGIPGPLGALVAVAVLGLGLFGVRSLGWRSWPARLLGAWSLLPPVALAVLSTRQPSFAARYLYPSLLPVVLLAAAGAAAFKAPQLRFAVIAAVAVTAFSGLLVQCTAQEVDWNGAADAVTSVTTNRPGPVPIAFIADDARMPFEYALRSRSSRSLRDLIPVAPAAPWGSFRTGDQRIVGLGTADIDVLAVAEVAIVVVAGAPGAPLPQDVVALERRAVRATLTVARFRGGIAVVVLRQAGS